MNSRYSCQTVCKDYRGETGVESRHLAPFFSGAVPTTNRGNQSSWTAPHTCQVPCPIAIVAALLNHFYQFLGLCWAVPRQAFPSMRERWTCFVCTSLWALPRKWFTFHNTGWIVGPGLGYYRCYERDGLLDRTVRSIRVAAYHGKHALPGFLKCSNSSIVSIPHARWIL